MREFPGYAEFCESEWGVRSCFPSRCEKAAQGGRVIVLIHSVKFESLILGESLRVTPYLKELQKLDAKELFLFVKINKLCQRIWFFCMSWQDLSSAGERFWLLYSRAKLNNGLENLPFAAAERCPVPRCCRALLGPVHAAAWWRWVWGDEWRVPGHPLELRHCRKINWVGLCRHLSGLNILDIYLSIFHISHSTVCSSQETFGWVRAVCRWRGAAAVCCSSCCLGIVTSTQVEKWSAGAFLLDRNSAATFLVIVSLFP